MARATRSSARQAAAASIKTASNGASNAVGSSIKKEQPDGEVPQSRRKRASTNPAPQQSSPSVSKRIKKEENHDDAPALPKTPTKATKKYPVKTEEDHDSPAKASPNTLQAKKLKAFNQYAAKSPFPNFVHPTADEARLAHKILASIHGERERPQELKAPTSRAGCGDSPSVLDALVRTILSQNTSDKNSTRAKQSMDKVYGGSDEWASIVEGGQPKLQEAIKSGGLAVVKSKVIISILSQVKEKYGEYSLDHLFQASDEDAMKELIGFQGVGPKTASCVLLFCLKRESFAVDTHVWRITGLLGWRPKSASRDETYAHLDVRIPDGEKYALHILFVKHGKVCDECKAGGKNLGKCELRRVFRDKAEKGEVSAEMPGHEDELKSEEDVKDEEDVQEKVKDESE